MESNQYLCIKKDQWRTLDGCFCSGPKYNEQVTVVGVDEGDDNFLLLQEYYYDYQNNCISGWNKKWFVKLVLDEQLYEDLAFSRELVE